VKWRPTLHNCVVKPFWSSGIMAYMVFTFEHNVPFMLYDASVVRHFLKCLINMFNKTKASIFAMQTMLHEDISFLAVD